MALSRKNLKLQLQISPFDPAKCNRVERCRANHHIATHKPCTQEIAVTDYCPLKLAGLVAEINNDLYSVKQIGKTPDKDERIRMIDYCNTVVHQFFRAKIDIRFYNDGTKAVEIHE